MSLPDNSDLEEVSKHVEESDEDLCVHAYFKLAKVPLEYDGLL